MEAVLHLDHPTSCVFVLAMQDFTLVEDYDAETKRLRAQMDALQAVLKKNQDKIRAETAAFGSLGGTAGAVEVRLSPLTAT